MIVASTGAAEGVHERYAATIVSRVVRVGRRHRQADLAVGHQVRAVGERHGALRALLDEQHGDAALADLGERLEDHVDDLRREAERGLVEQQDVGPGDERARDRELLLLAAREHAGAPAPELLDDREERVDGFDVLGARRRASGGPDRPRRRFSSTVRSAKMRRPSGTSEMPERVTCLGRAAAQRLAREPDLAAARAARGP